MVNKQNIALALGKIEEILALVDDVGELLSIPKGEYRRSFHIQQADTLIDECSIALFSAKKHLKEAMNEN